MDSQAAILALGGTDCKSALVRDTHLLLNELGRHKMVSIYWTKAHCGNVGNERADQLQGVDLTVIN